MIASRIAALAGPLVLLAACTQADQEPRAMAGLDTSRQCFFTSSINGFNNAPDGPNREERLTVSTGPRDDWLFEVIGPCIELDFAEDIAFAPRTRPSLCTGDRETLLVPSTMSSRGFERCQVRLLGRLLPEEDDAAGESADEE